MVVLLWDRFANYNLYKSINKIKRVLPNVAVGGPSSCEELTMAVSAPTNRTTIQIKSVLPTLTSWHNGKQLQGKSSYEERTGPTLTQSLSGPVTGSSGTINSHNIQKLLQQPHWLESARVLHLILQYWSMLRRVLSKLLNHRKDFGFNM